MSDNNAPIITIKTAADGAVIGYQPNPGEMSGTWLVNGVSWRYQSASGPKGIVGALYQYGHRPGDKAYGILPADLEAAQRADAEAKAAHDAKPINRIKMARYRLEIAEDAVKEDRAAIIAGGEVLKPVAAGLIERRDQARRALQELEATYPEVVAELRAEREREIAEAIRAIDNA